MKGARARVVGAIRAVPRRIGRLPTVVAAVGGLAAVSVAGWAIVHRQKPADEIAEAAPTTTAPDSSSVLGRIPREGEIANALLRSVAPNPNVQQAVVRVPGQPAAAARGEPAEQPKPPEDDIKREALRQAWRRHYEQQQEVTDARHQRSMAARAAPLQPQQAGTQGGQGLAAGGDGGGASLTAAADVAGLGGAAAGGRGAPRPGTLYQGPGRPGGEYLAAAVMPALSGYELKEGDFVPCGVDGGIVSEAPGKVRLLVSRNVTDGTGTRTMIPAGAELVGSYDQNTPLGADRLPTGITRVIFPPVGSDGRRDSLSIGSQPATDAAGNAGLHDQVDRRFWRTLGNGFISFLFRGASQAAMVGMGQAAPIGAALGNAAGQEIGLAGNAATRGAIVGPILRIRPGYACGWRLTQDIVFPGEWIDGVGFVPRGAPRGAVQAGFSR